MRRELQGGEVHRWVEERPALGRLCGIAAGPGALSAVRSDKRYKGVQLGTGSHLKPPTRVSCPSNLTVCHGLDPEVCPSHIYGHLMGSSLSKPRPQESQVGGMSTFAIGAHHVGGWRALRA